MNDTPRDTAPETTSQHSLAARVTAIGFITLILLGNFWVIRAVTGSPIPSWFPVISLIGILTVFTGGTILAIGFMRRYLHHD